MVDSNHQSSTRVYVSRDRKASSQNKLRMGARIKHSRVESLTRGGGGGGGRKRRKLSLATQRAPSTHRLTSGVRLTGAGVGAGCACGSGAAGHSTHVHQAHSSLSVGPSARDVAMRVAAVRVAAASEARARAWAVREAREKAMAASRAALRRMRAARKARRNKRAAKEVKTKVSVSVSETSTSGKPHSHSTPPRTPQYGSHEQLQWDVAPPPVTSPSSPDLDTRSMGTRDSLCAALRRFTSLPSSDDILSDFPSELIPVGPKELRPSRMKKQPQPVVSVYHTDPLGVKYFTK